MARILCNLPLECFDERQRYLQSGLELVSYGPPERMVVDGVHYPFDVEFDPSTGSWQELFDRLPNGFRPDFLLIYWPEQEPLPRDLEHCPVPVVGVMSDYNLGLHLTAGLWPFFDVLLCDTRGVDLYEALSFADVRRFVQFSFKAPSHRIHAVPGRDVDVAFAGNLNPRIQAERAPFLDRLRALGDRGVHTQIVSGVHGDEYGRLLSRAKIGFNRSVRGEMNLRAFEVPACGALLLMEASNHEVREFLVPGEEVVLYEDDALEETVLDLLQNEPLRARIAAAGHRKIQKHRMPERIAALVELLGDLQTQRTPSTPADAALGRARALAQTWADPRVIARTAFEAHELAPDVPSALNDVAVAMLRADPSGQAERAFDLLHRTLELDPNHVVAASNAHWMASRTTDATIQRRATEILENALAGANSWANFDGLLMPPGFDERNLQYCGALATALRSVDLGPLRAWFTSTLAAATSSPSVATVG